jgi:hypothetical protein
MVVVADLVLVVVKTSNVTVELAATLVCFWEVPSKTVSPANR